MPILWINIFIVLCLLLTVGIPAFGEITKEKRWKKRPTWRFWIMLLLSAATFLLGQYKDDQKEILNKAGQYQKDSIAQISFKKEQAHRDSVAKADADSSVAKVVKSFAKGIGEYSLRMDSGFNGVIKLVRDSAKRVINQTSEPEPYFGACLNDYGSKNNYVTFKYLSNGQYQNDIFLCSRYATASNIDAHVVYVIKNRNSYEISNNYTRLLPKFTSMADRQQQTVTKTIGIADNPSNITYVYLYGSYQNSLRNKTFVINELYSVSYKSNEINGKSVAEESEVKTFLYNNDSILRQFFISNQLVP